MTFPLYTRCPYVMSSPPWRTHHGLFKVDSALFHSADGADQRTVIEQTNYVKICIHLYSLCNGFEMTDLFIGTTWTIYGCSDTFRQGNIHVPFLAFLFPLWLISGLYILHNWGESAQELSQTGGCHMGHSGVRLCNSFVKRGRSARSDGSRRLNVNGYGAQSATLLFYTSPSTQTDALLEPATWRQGGKDV